MSAFSFPGDSRPRHDAASRHESSLTYSHPHTNPARIADKRQAEAQRIRTKYPERIPVRHPPISNRPRLRVRRSRRLLRWENTWLIILSRRFRVFPSRLGSRNCLPRVDRPTHALASRLAGHRRESREERHPGPGQEEVLGTRGPDGRAVRVRHPQADQALAREGHLRVCEQRAPPHGGAHVLHLRRAQRRRRVPIHRVQRREHLRGRGRRGAPRVRDEPPRDDSARLFARAGAMKKKTTKAWSRRAFLATRRRVYEYDCKTTMTNAHHILRLRE